MKYKKRLKNLEARIAFWNNIKEKAAFMKPGSEKK